jgi:hypothetical protein
VAKCVSHKNSYATATLAEDALIEAHTRFDFAPGQGPIAIYRCDDCGEYHLTSRGPQNEKLTEFLKSGQLPRLKEGNWWLNKLKK